MRIWKFQESHFRNWTRLTPKLLPLSSSLIRWVFRLLITAFFCISMRFWNKKIWRRWYDQKLLFGCLLLAAVVITAAIEYRIAYHLRYWLFYDRNYDRSKIIFNSWRDFFNIRMKNFSLSFIYQQSQTCTGYSWNFFNEKFCLDCIRQQWVKILSLFVT